MKVRLILIGMLAGLALPLAAVNAGATFDPGLNHASVGAHLERGVAPIAENFGRNENEDKDKDKDKDDHDHKCDHGDYGDKSDHDCDKDSSKPH